MRAAVCTAFNTPLEIQDLSLGQPVKGEVKVKIEAVAICHSDISFMRGYWGGQLPAIYGHEAAGIILETGPEVDGFKAGDRVIVTLMRSCGTCPACHHAAEALCDMPPELGADAVVKNPAGEPILSAMNTGAFAEEVIIHQRQLVALDADIDMDIGALIGCGVITGYGAVTRVAKVAKGEDVAVIGCGGVGMNAIQAARISGASVITAIDASDAKEEICRKLGATHFVNPLTDSDHSIAKSIPEYGGYDVVLVAVGLPKVIEEAVGLLRPGGRLVVMGMPPSGEMVEVEMTNLAAYGQSIIGTKMGSAMIREDIPEIIRLYRAGEWELDGLVSHRFQFDDINAALDMASQPDSLRVMVTFD